jgi:hypothetical protein
MDPGNQDQVRWIVSRPMAAEVDMSGVLLQPDPAVADLGRQNTVRVAGGRGEPYLMGVRALVERG